MSPSQIYDIAGIRIQMNHHYETYLKDNLERYRSDSATYEHVIDVILSDEIIDLKPKLIRSENPHVGYKDGKRIIYNLTEDHRIKNMMVHDSDYQETTIYIHPNINKDPAELEYVLLGIAVLEICLRHQLLPLHASAILYNNEALLFSGPSQSGKTTHTRLWQTVFPDLVVLNDDKPLIGLKDNRFMVYSSPFSGKTKANLNITAPIKAIIFLEQFPSSEVLTLDTKEKMVELIRNILRPEEAHLWASTTSLLTRLIDDIPIVKLRATKDERAVHVIHHYLYQGDMP